MTITPERMDGIETYAKWLEGKGGKTNHFASTLIWELLAEVKGLTSKLAACRGALYEIRAIVVEGPILEETAGSFSWEDKAARDLEDES